MESHKSINNPAMNGEILSPSARIKKSFKNRQYMTVLSHRQELWTESLNITKTP